MGVPLAGVPSQKPNTLSLLQDFSSSAPIGVPIMPAGRAAEEFIELSGLEPKISEPKKNLTCYHYTITQFEVFSVGIKSPFFNV